MTALWSLMAARNPAVLVGAGFSASAGATAKPAMVVASLLVRDGTAAQPLGYLLGAIVFAVATAAALH